MKTHTFAPAAKTAGADAIALQWVVLNGRDSADQAWIATQSGFDDGIKVIASQPPTRSDRARLDAAIVMSVVRRDDATGDEPVGLHIVVEARRIAAICFGTDAIIGEAFAREASRNAPASQSRLLSLIVAALISQLQPELVRLAEKIDALEDAAMKDSDTPIDDQVVNAGQQVLALRRYLAPMRYEMSYLSLNPEELPGAAEPEYLRRAAETLERLVGALDGSHNRVMLVLNQLSNRDTSRLERSMHKLTLVATVFLPLSFITGLLGINVAGIPDSHNPFGFWLVCALLIGVAVASILVIRWKKWM